MRQFRQLQLVLRSVFHFFLSWQFLRQKHKINPKLRFQKKSIQLPHFVYFLSQVWRRVWKWETWFRFSLLVQF